MYNPENEYNCDECPENKDFDDWEGKYPCGQQNCWVTCHCREIKMCIRDRLTNLQMNK